MRLIDADARVTVQSFDEEHEEYDHTEMSVEEALDFATDEGCPPVVDAAPTVGGWISVKDRLPENAEDVLVFMERDAWGDGDEAVRKREVGIGYQIAGRWHVDGCSRVTGLYWQYLPEPPKEDNDAGQ